MSEGGKMGGGRERQPARQPASQQASQSVRRTDGARERQRETGSSVRNDLSNMSYIL